MSAGIIIKIESNDKIRQMEVGRKVIDESVTPLEKKLVFYYLLATGRGLAKLGAEQDEPILLKEAAEFIRLARETYEKASEEERKA